MNTKAARKRPVQFYILLTLAVIATVVCVGSLVGATILEGTTYADLIAPSKTAGIKIRQESYRKAISLKPEEDTAYLLLLDTYSEDSSFTKAESDAFLAVYNANKSKISDTSEICTKAGLLYVNAFEGSAAAKFRMALPFLQQASPADRKTKTIISCYANMGRIYQDYIWSAGSKEISAKKMERLLSDIDAALEGLENNTEPTVVHNKLSFSVAVCALLSEQRDVLATTVPENAVIDILNRIYAGLPDPEAFQQEASKEAAKQLSDNKSTYYDAIHRAYERTEVA